MEMFYGCTSLVTAPALPATTLAEECYGSMFQGCTLLELEDIPALPATTLAEGCYDSTFGSINGISMSDSDYETWCSENIPANANYNDSIHGTLFDVTGGGDVM